MSPIRKVLALTVITLASQACTLPPEEAAPLWCQSQGAIDASCSGEHCVAAVVIDYRRLEPRGVQVFSISGGQAITFNDAEALVDQYIDEVLNLPAPPFRSCEPVISFMHCTAVYEDGSRLRFVYHRASGGLVFAGPEIWADTTFRGQDAPLGEGYADPEPIGCVDPVGPAAQRRLRNTDSPLGSEPPSTAVDALEVTQKLNFTADFINDQPYEIFVVNYSLSIGEFDPATADWYAFIQRGSP